MMTTYQLLSEFWDERSPVWSIILLATVIYTFVAVTHSASRRQIAFFVLSAIALALALASPLALLATRYSFGAHMAQHLLLLLLVPLFATLAWPSSGSPSEDGLSDAAQRRMIFPGWLAGVAAMWFWHIPALCTAAMQHSSVFAMQSISLVAAGAAFWWPIFRPQLQRRLEPQAAAVYLFSGCVGCSLLGIYVTFSPSPVCPLYEVGGGSPALMHLVHQQWGLTHRVDQQIGGLLMWVPACMIYLTAILQRFASWYQVPEGRLASE